MTIIQLHIKIVFLLSLAVFSCADLENNENSLTGSFIHPAEEFMPDLATNLVKTKPGLFANTTKNITNSTVIDSIKGNFNTGGFFGDITDIDFDEYGNIYVLDGRVPILKKYSSDGEFISGYGGIKGRGPTDFFAPTALSVLNDTIYVSDSFYTIKVLKSSGNIIEYLDTITLPEMVPLDMCILDRNLFFRTIGESSNPNDSTTTHLIHVYSLEEKRFIRSFGNLYNTARNATNLRLSGGIASIECHEHTGSIIYTFDSSPYIYSYSISGKLNWVSKLKPFYQPKFIETVKSGRTTSWKFNYEGSRIHDLNTFQDSLIYISTITTHPDLTRPLYDGFILSASNGNSTNLKFNHWIMGLNDSKIYIKDAHRDIKLMIRQY